MTRAMTDAPIITASTVLGIGLGGFADGILFHQLMQSHHMVSGSDYYPDRGLPAETLVVNLQINTFWDGVFHAVVWLTIVIGLILLWRAVRRAEVPRSNLTFTGGLLLSWGLFNLIEGVVDHHVLHLHHVVESADHAMFDYGFLASGLILIVLGAIIVRRGRHNKQLLSPELAS